MTNILKLIIIKLVFICNLQNFLTWSENKQMFRINNFVLENFSDFKEILKDSIKTLKNISIISYITKLGDNDDDEDDASSTPAPPNWGTVYLNIF